MPPSKFEANPTLHLWVKRASFSLASSCLNDYFRAYVIIDFLSNRLVFLNTVTYKLCWSVNLQTQLLYLRVLVVEHT